MESKKSTTGGTSTYGDYLLVPVRVGCYVVDETSPDHTNMVQYTLERNQGPNIWS